MSWVFLEKLWLGSRRKDNTEDGGTERTEVDLEKRDYHITAKSPTAVLVCASMLPDQYPHPAEPIKLIHGELSEQIIGAAIEVHRLLGPGLMESIYEECFCRELELRSIAFERQRPVDVEYKGIKIECALRPDLIVQDKIVVELKAAEHNIKLFEAQLMTYLKLTKKRVGLLINFGLPVLRQGVVRRVL